MKQIKKKKSRPRLCGSWRRRRWRRRSPGVGGRRCGGAAADLRVLVSPPHGAAEDGEEQDEEGDADGDADEEAEVLAHTWARESSVNVTL